MSLPSFDWITRKYLEKRAKMWFQFLKAAAISWDQGRLTSNLQFADNVSLTTSNVSTKFRWKKTEYIWRKVQTILFQSIKMAAISPRARLFEVTPADEVPLTTSNVSTKFRCSIQNRLGQKCNSVIFFEVKWPPFCRILSICAQTLHCTPGPPKIYVCAKYYWDLRSLQYWGG